MFSMESIKNVAELLLSASLGVVGAWVGALVLVTVRVALSSRRRRQFVRVREQSRNVLLTMRRMLFESPEIGDDTNPAQARLKFGN